MFTPQQIDQISFGRSTFGGYDMQQVDEFLEPLTEDYVTLYKENALLKSKMRVLVGKLEEYRKNEAATKEAVLNAQKTSEKMVREAEAKCAQMLSNASATAAAKAAEADTAAKAAETTKMNDALVAAENARVEEARKTAAIKINELQEQLRSCIQALDRIKGANAPATPVAPAAPAAPAPKAEPAKPAFDFDSDAVADEISKSLENLVGTTTDHAPKAAPKHPINDTTTSKFSTLNLQFGRNYDLGK
ncbi:MAG: DivIVA domain-containing protein [Oscillospiraceae bacterium]|nr:DivIVA domain-containing protein [Oscillospiraceae bacterium]